MVKRDMMAAPDSRRCSRGHPMRGTAKLCVAPLFLFVAQVHAGLFKCTDADGAVNYQDRPCSGEQKSTRIAPRVYDNSTADLNAPPPQSQSPPARQGVEAKSRDAQRRDDNSGSSASDRSNDAEDRRRYQTCEHQWRVESQRRKKVSFVCDQRGYKQPVPKPVRKKYIAPTGLEVEEGEWYPRGRMNCAIFDGFETCN